jgi:hypothetical protein
MWVIEEYRQVRWAQISAELPEPDAWAAMRLLRLDRPWRAYRVVRANAAW